MVDYQVVDTSAILSVNNPPVNAASAHVKIALVENLNRARNDSNVKSIIICGKGTFIGGADIKEFPQRGVPGDESQAHFTFQDVCNKLEACEKPVIAAINGYALGGGLEVAISCHYRVAHQNTSFGFPEVTLGILPAATGSQRFPRLTSLQAALDLIVSGRRIGSSEALKLQIIDKVTDGDVVSVACDFAKSVVDKPVVPRRASGMTVRDAGQAQQLKENSLALAARKYPGLLAPVFCIKAVMASVELPFAQGLLFERQCAELLQSSGQARALQYAFFAERQATKWQLSNGRSSSNVKPKPVKSVGVIGAGTMGAGIAMAILSAGYPVILMENNKELLDKGLESVCKLLEGSVAVKKLSEKACKDAFTRLRGTLQFTDLKDVDLVIEAVFENMALKKQIFAELDKACKSDAILCSNTSSLDIDQMAASTQRPDKVMGMHFFVPAYHMKLLENVKSLKTSPETIATVMAFSKRINKVPVLVGNCWSFAANRIWKPLRLENEFLVEEGADPADVDQVMENFGFPLGPFKVSDLTGLDVSFKILTENLATKGLKIDLSRKYINGERFCPLLPVIVEKNRLGRKNGRGWYKYEKPGAKVPFYDNEVTDIIEKFRKFRDVEARKITQQVIEEKCIVDKKQEILTRCVLAAINEAFKVLEEGIANSPEAVDTIMLLAFAWPRQTGGPLFYARQIGLAKVYADICELHQRFPASHHWYPSELLRKIVHDDIPVQNWSKAASPFHSSRL